LPIAFEGFIRRLGWWPAMMGTRTLRSDEPLAEHSEARDAPMVKIGYG
jgi:hypothetical protein